MEAILSPHTTIIAIAGTGDVSGIAWPDWRFAAPKTMKTMHRNEGVRARKVVSFIGHIRATIYGKF